MYICFCLVSTVLAYIYELLLVIIHGHDNGLPREGMVGLARMEGTQFVAVQRLNIQSCLCDELTALKKSWLSSIPLGGGSTII